MRSRKRKRKKQVAVSFDSTQPVRSLEQACEKEKYLDLFIVAILLVLSIYQSSLYFGHQVVPNSDFPSFVGVARSVLSFEVPSSFKRLPGLGLMQIGLSNFVSGLHPVLTAGLLLNAIVHPFSIILLYLTAKRMIDKSAPWLAVIVAINPWTISMLVQPMAETSLLFFTIVTFFFISRRSNLSYVFASIATVVRYDAAALIVAVLLADMITRKQKREKLLALLWASMASLPLIVWIIGTYYYRETSSPGHYIGHYTQGKHIGFGYFKLLWEATCKPLLQLPAYIKAVFVSAPSSATQANSIKAATDCLYGFSQVLFAIGFLSGVIWTFVKKNHNAIAILVFFAVTAGVHTRRMVSTQRYCVLLIWISLLMCCYGWQNIFGLINHKEKLPRPVVITFQSIAAIIAIAWFIRLVPFLSKAAPYSRRSVSLPFVTIGVVVLLFFAGSFVYRRRHVLRFLALSALVCLMAVSNQFTLARMVGNGDTDAEFKKLADWYVRNARPNENLVTTMPHVVRLFAPQHSKYFIPTSRIKADDPAGFVQACYNRKVTYVAWDSRIGLTPNNSYYKKWGISRIAMLAKPQSIGPYEFVTQLKQNDRRYINIFKLRTNLPRQ